ncbi:MAG: phage tail tape measure protein, partial [Thermomicrobiales bacterium]|nr:phage tail tape measure protein [Thermomicrobiales bacterium]
MATIAELTAVITADISGLTAGVSEANQQLNDLGKGAGQAGKDVGKAADGFNAAGKLMAAGGAAMLAPMVDAVRGAANLQQAMDQVGVAFNATDEQAAALQDTILDVASSTIFGAKDVAEAANIMGKAGVSVEDATGGMLQATADFAAATGTQLPTAADIMTRTAAQWGIAGEDMISVADDLTTIFNETSLGAEDWLGGMANFAPQMRLAGASLEETGAALGFFKDMGLSAREAGTSLTRAMDAMIAPTDKQAEAMANLGITTEDFFEIGADGQRQFIGWADTFDMLNDKMSGLDDIQKAAALSALFGKEAYDALGLGMLADTDKLRDLTRAMEDNDGIARKQSDALTDNLLGSIEELGGAYDKLRVRMGDPFLDPLQAGVEGVTGLVNALADADPAVQGFVGKLMAGAGGLLMFGGGALFGIGKLMDLGRTAAQGGRAIMDLGKMVGGAGKSLLDFGKNVLPTVGKAATGVGKSVMDMGRKLAQLGPVAMDAGRSLMRGVGTALPKIGKAAVNAGKSIMRSLAGLGPVGLGLAAALGVGLLAYESNFLGFGDWVDDQVATKIKPALEAAGKQFKSTVEGLGAFKDALMAGDWNSAWDQSIGGLGRFKDTHFAEQIAGLGAFKDALMAGDWDAAWDQSIGGLQRFKDENFSENLKSSIDGLGAFKDALM